MALRDRLDTLEAAKSCVLEGSYSDAIRILDVLLRNSPSDVEALCLKGQALELSVYEEEMEQPPVREARYDPRLVTARDCFETALRIEPDSTIALRDLADHLKNVGDVSLAKHTYDRLLHVLRSQGRGEDDEELSDALVERAELDD